MRRFLHPQNLIPAAIIAAVAAMVVYANVRDGRRIRQPYTAAPPIGTPGAPRTSREDLDRRVAEMDARLAKHPEDAGAALLLSDALLRQTRITGNPGLTLRAEHVLTRVLRDAPGSYDANACWAPSICRSTAFATRFALPKRIARRDRTTPRTMASSAMRRSSSATTTR